MLKEKKINVPKTPVEKTSIERIKEQRAKVKIYPDPTPYERRLWGWDK
jgi:hypothetical protein